MLDPVRAAAMTVGAAVVAMVVLGTTGCSGASDRGSAARSTATPRATPTASDTPDPSGAASAARSFAALETRNDARLGVVAIDTGSGRVTAYREDERFAFASTNKVFIAAAVLHTSTAADLDTVVDFDRSDLLEYAPVTSKAVDSGMTVRALVDAALRYSDNTAANLLVEHVGGVDAVQAFLGSIGDHTTRVNRLEPALNEATPGDARDTTTPKQFAADLRAVLLDDALDPADRELLRSTMLGNTTGDTTIRAGVDPTWPVADKTGTGSYGVRNDIAVVYPPGRKPIVVVVMTSRDAPDATPSDALVAAATKAAVASLGAESAG